MITTAKTPKGRTVTIGEAKDGGIREAAGTGQYVETAVMFGSVKVSSYGYYSCRDLPGALTVADEFIDTTGLQVTE